MHDQLRQRFCQNLRRAGVDVYIAVTPANFRYLSGYNSAFIDLSWQMTGTDMVVLPADSDLEPAVIVSEYCAPDARRHSDISDIRTYSLWTENRRYEEICAQPSALLSRPMQYDYAEIFGLVRDIVRSRGLSDGVIGSDLSLMKHETYEALKNCFPGNRLVDCRDVAYRTRQIKHPAEILELRKAARLFDIGTGAAFDALHEGQHLADIQHTFEASLRDAVRRDAALDGFERSFFFPHVGTGDGQLVRSGDVIKLDCGARVNGYWSDGCRHLCMGKATFEQRQIHRALTAGFEVAREMLRPGVRIGDIFNAAIRTVRENGLNNYSRGHVGHSIGLDDQTEEPPFLGPTDDILEEGMVVCLELPFYPSDQGGFNVEDMFLISEGDPEPLTLLEHGFRELH
ncbi:Xaa-Pro peptidase family protein [Mesorhizobium australafricanum]|uniref:Xaa-Pro peptidase family protein n=1 Tax=Mesorhizobium australafricanum TaxID=3072311 RepID=A0ABU4X828_9HYPH|nr:Xaa-Pro peptidase family protein [Mesorhizobium sp. VK3E]MDX8443678.1 Xaa-Pro peptidase family protein [Mesorhizobium sp. VK3E]